MSKFVQHASYYLDDKDLSDLFKAQHVAPRFLLKFLRRRGLFLSERSSKSDLVLALCMAPISWDDVNEIAEAINTEERDGRQMITRLTDGFDLNEVPAALERVKTWIEGLRETPTLTKTGENSYRLEVRFVELQPQRTRPLQRVERRVIIEVERVGERLDIRYTEHEHAEQIVQKIKDEIPAKPDQGKSQRQISLSTVRDPLLRTQFFIDLISSVDGFVVAGVSGLNVDRRFPDEQEREEEEEEFDNERAEQIVGLVKRAVLSGDSLLHSKLYRELRESGYYIGNVVWTANETGGDQRQVEFCAGFKDLILANEFVFGVRGAANRENDGSHGKLEKIQPGDRASLLKLIESAAYRALEGLENSTETALGALPPPAAIPPTIA